MILRMRKPLGISAGASAPEILVEEVIEALRARFTVTLEVINKTRARHL